jgi:hypothetical protein
MLAASVAVTFGNDGAALLSCGRRIPVDLS